MTYNPEDWNPGDLVIMEIDLDLVRITSDLAVETNRGRQLRMLVIRDARNQNTSERALWWQGARGAVKANLRNPHAVTYIERVYAVDQPTLDRANLNRTRIFGSNWVPR